jgi:FkbM family methyltransferase
MKRRFYSLLFWLLIKKSGFRYRGRWRASLWKHFWERSQKKYKGTIGFRLHGVKVEMNNGNPYPLFLNTYPKYNLPLVEIVHQLSQTLDRPIDYVDVGAAIGDTMLLLLQRCPDKIHSFYCIDGDERFCEYMKYNLREQSRGHIIHAMLSGSETKRERKLVSTHPGTFSAHGEEFTEAVSLDALLTDTWQVDNVDLIKTDLDGLDGTVLSGAGQILEKYHPVCIFEWHPYYIRKTGNSPLLPFEILLGKEYDRFLFYDKYGNFSHFSFRTSEAEIQFLENFCLRGNYQPDWHYDVIALPRMSEVDVYELAELTYST